MSKEVQAEMNFRLQKMKHILNEAGSGKGKLRSDTGEMDTYIMELDSLVDELVKLVDGLQNGDKKTQTAVKLFGFSLPSLFSSSVKVQVFMRNLTSSSEEVAAAISKLCKDLSYKCETISQVNDLNKTLPLVVLCPIESRFEIDISSALDDLKWSSDFLTLLLHSGTQGSLPILPTATRLSDREKYRNVEFIDIALTPESKLYRCKMNEDARRKVIEFIDNYKNTIIY